MHSITEHRNQNVLQKLVILLTSASLFGMGLWAWIKSESGVLPTPESSSGKALIRQYQGTAYDIWLILLGLSICFIVNRIYISKRKERLKEPHIKQGAIKSILDFIRNNPIASIAFIIYTVGMISGTTYLYKDMVGWYPDLIKGYFLDNFSLRGSFISETMRRSDYRFFPLAHQDLHILSWFTVHIKTWMLASAAELVSIVLLIINFLNELEPGKKAKQSTIILTTFLLLIHPSTGTTFFHVIYCERLLCLVFALYISSYLHYRNTAKKSSFYLTFLWALIGIFIKDIAILLFIIPAACMWIFDVLKNHSTEQEGERKNLSQKKNKLEKWICSLTLAFIASYIFLALIPSSYASEGYYNEDIASKIVLDIRFYLFIAIAFYRIIEIFRQRIKFNLLDAINISALAYATALALSYEFLANSYLAMPVQLIGTINIGWLWIYLIEKNKIINLGPSSKIFGSVFVSAFIIGTEHATEKNTFANNIASQKFEQNYIQSTYEALDNISRKIRESGDDVNIIINRKSRLSAERHLNRIPYKSLIEYEAAKDKFIVKDGAHKGENYKPKVGDIIANLDKYIELIEPISEKVETEVIYRHNPSPRTGVILRITKAKD